MKFKFMTVALMLFSAVAVTNAQYGYPGQMPPPVYMPPPPTPRVVCRSEVVQACVFNMNTAKMECHDEVKTDCHQEAQ